MISIKQAIYFTTGWWKVTLECGHTIMMQCGVDYNPINTFIECCIVCRDEVRHEG